MQLIDLFERGVGYGADETCVQTASDGLTFTYREVDVLSHQIANGLEAAGVAPGEKVGLLADNHVMTLLAILGIVRSAGVWLPVNARNSAAETANILARTDCIFLFIHSAYAGQIEAVRGAMPLLKGIVCIDRELEGIPALADWAAAQSAERVERSDGADAVVAIRGTGGTTGLPKGVMITHRNALAVMANWFAAMPVSERPVHLVVAPLSHAASYVAFTALAYGGRNIILSTTDAETILGAIERYRVTQIFLPPTLIYKLLDHPQVRRFDFSSLRSFVYSAAPMSTSRLREALDVFGPVMVQCFGQAEAPFVCACLTAQDHADILEDPTLSHRLASCGRPSPFVRMGIMDEIGTLLAAGERGEIVVRSELVMKGYFNDPVKTGDALRDGWLHTGDVGYFDADGFCYIVDRLKDLIVSGGFNISPGEIEQILWTVEAIGDCAVIGVPDPLWGEAVKAVVELKSGCELDTDAVLALCREQLGAMKTPKSIEIWDSLPRSAVGKILKREIRERFWVDHDRRV